MIHLLLSFFSLFNSCWACTVFSVSGSNQQFVGRNYDWDTRQGLVFVNKRSVFKKAPIQPPAVPVSWKSKFGSVTFNQYGREFPQGGINEKGLLVEVLYLSTAVYPKPDSRPTISELQWIQYQLDLFATTQEVIQHLAEVQISRAQAPVHYFVCDSSGDCAAIEPINGKMVVSHQKTMPISALANNTYQESLKATESSKVTIPKTETEAVEKSSSLERFTRVALLSKSFQNHAKISDLFEILAKVPRKDTQWSIVYELTQPKLTWKTHQVSTEKTILLKELDFSCLKPTQVLNVDFARKGEVLKYFENYTERLNEKMIRQSITPDFVQVPKERLEEIILQLVHYPETTVCAER